MDASVSVKTGGTAELDDQQVPWESVTRFRFRVIAVLSAAATPCMVESAAAAQGGTKLGVHFRKA